MGFYISTHLARCRRSRLHRDLGWRRPHFQDSFYHFWCAIFACCAGCIFDWRSLLLTDAGLAASTGGPNAHGAAGMVATIPTTLAGVVALLRYVHQQHDVGNPLLDEDVEQLLSTTVSALVTIGGGS